ncbi:helix-turn-helix domain-containing protein [Fictibacillus phosphorivorans]|uniref:helix-turn-helix domain-containing protein n=1 Tax=Fictibacillus phosphorivorans TaxID=1221500 RepID=UPI003CE6A913
MEKEPCISYGQQIAKLREKEGITQVQFASLLGVELVTVENVERGKCHPTDVFLERLSSVLSINPFDLKQAIWCDETQEECKTIS